MSEILSWTQPTVNLLEKSIGASWSLIKILVIYSNRFYGGLSPPKNVSCNVILVKGWNFSLNSFKIKKKICKLGAIVSGPKENLLQ